MLSAVVFVAPALDADYFQDGANTGCVEGFAPVEGLSDHVVPLFTISVFTSSIPLNSPFSATIVPVNILSHPGQID